MYFYTKNFYKQISQHVCDSLFQELYPILFNFWQQYIYSADYKTSARRNADVKLEFSGAVRRTSATCADAKKFPRVGRGIHVGNPSERRRCSKFAKWPFLHSEKDLKFAKMPCIHSGAV